ncbi:MAG TPA: phosphoribosylamine--glycine ligase [Verrucomicrobiae bacterium]|jgi:phosphoribosylamine--glycine ligase|nr:phosphoribosylamine--glycine ligase [Verrucomicrobiae bacterium]
MKILVVGGGGREHALVWKLSQSSRVEKIYAAPGNDGIGESAELAAIAADDIDKLAAFAEKKQVDLTVVGPELPLTLGVAELFQQRGLRIFAPGCAAARLEGSKAFAKEILHENKIPTAAFGTFSDARQAKKYLSELKPPFVVKADGLAAGKGVLICSERSEAEAAIDDVLTRRVFGAAGDKVVVEEFLEGEEASFIVLTDGDHILPLASSQDHKRVFDNDEGPNTGGMGAYSPAPVVTPELHRRIVKEILEPLLRGLKRRGIDYRGTLYAGLMLTAGGPKVLEFNARFGDPECQPLMLRLKSDLVPLVEATIDGRLNEVEAEWYDEAAVCVVLTAGGYPGDYAKGQEIHGLERLKDWRKGAVFHAGTTKKNGRWLTAGGRVLGVTGRGAGISQAVAEAYRAVAQIHWEGMHYRKDIARRALK